MEQQTVKRIRLLVYEGPEDQMQRQYERDTRYHRWGLPGTEMVMKSFEVQGPAFEALIRSIEEAEEKAKATANETLSNALEGMNNPNDH
jgi:hypothetical protein